jgi:hypothetical protein
MGWDSNPLRFPRENRGLALQAAQKAAHPRWLMHRFLWMRRLV